MRHRQSGYPGSIIDVLRAAEQGVDLIGQYMMQQQQMMQQQPQVASTPEQYEQGLRPAHQAGNTNQSMIFPNVPPNTPFNTMGMKAPINIQKFDEQGHLVKSYENVPPGVQSLPTGPQRGTVIETPANMQSGGRRLREEAMEMFPALEALGNVKVKTDKNFTPEATGLGSIEYFGPGQKQVTYPTGNVFKHPGSDKKHAVLVNPDLNDSQDVALDLLHGLSKVDPEYNEMLQKFGDSLDQEEIKYWYDQDAASGLAMDGYDQFRQNYIDGKLRNLLYEGSEEDFERARYNPNERAFIQTNNPAAFEQFQKIQSYLKKSRKFQSAGALEFGQTGPDFETYGPGLRIDGETYQASRETGATRVPLFEDGTQRPILLGAAEVYDEPISSVPQDYTPETKALADEGAAGVAGRRNQAAIMGLSAAGDYFSTLQRYGVSAPLSLAMGKQPNLSATPLLDRALGKESPNAFPSEILGVQNPYGAIALDIATDPMAALSLATLGRQGIKNAPYVARNFKDIRGARKFGKGYGYARKYRPSYSNIFSTENTDNAIRGLAEQHNTVTRGVSTDLASMSNSRREAVSSLLSEAGIDPSKVGPGLDPIETRKAAEFFMTRYAGDTGFGRFGTREFLSKNPQVAKGTLYTSNSPGTARGYTYGEGYVADLRRQGLDFSGPRSDWLRANDWKTAQQYKEELGDVILGERNFSGRTILTPEERTETALNRFFQDRSTIVTRGPSGQVDDMTLRYGFLNDPLSRKRFGQILEEETKTVSRIRPELNSYQVQNLARQRAGVRFGISDRLEAIDPTRFGRDGLSTNVRGFDIHRGSQSVFSLPEVQRSTSVYDRALHTLGRGIDAARYNYFRHSAQPALDLDWVGSKINPTHPDFVNLFRPQDKAYSHFIFTGPAGERAPLDIINMRRVTGLRDEIGGQVGPGAGGRGHEGQVGKYSVNYKSGGPRKFQTGGAVAESTRNDIFVPDFELLQASRETKEFNERQKQIERLNDQGEIKPAGRGAPPNAMAYMPPGLKYNQIAAGKYIEENPLSNPVSMLALGSTAAVAAPVWGKTAVGRALAKPYIDKPLRYGFGAHSVYDLSNIRNWEGDGQAMMERLGVNMLGIAGIAPAAMMLKSAIGQAGRNALYYSVDPLGYAPKIYGPKGAWKNYKDPLGRPARVNENINTSYYNPFSDKGAGQSAAERRLDLWSASLGRTPDYGTLTHLGGNKYSLAGEHVNLHSLQGDIERSLRAQEYARQMQQYKAAVAAGNKSAKPPAKVDWADFEGYSPHSQVTHFKGHQVASRRQNPPSARILSDEKTRVTNLRDETFNTMAGYELELLHPKMGNIHDPSRIAGIQAASPGSNVVQDFRYHNRPLTVTMRDTWDLHPFDSQIFQDKFLRGLPERIQRGIVDRFKNTEAISAVGGKPLDLRTTFHVENPLAMEGRNATFTHTHTGRKYEVGPYDGTAMMDVKRQMFEMEAKTLGSRYNKPYVQSVGPFEQIPTSINRPGDVPGYMPPFWMRK